MALSNRTATAPVSVQFQSACFGCGVDNPEGLQLNFHFDDDGVAAARWVPDHRWEGLRGIVHGGIVATLLDEAMAKAVARAGCKTMTAELRVRFRQLAKSGETLQVRGWIVKQKRRVVETEASVSARDGAELAHGWGAFLSIRGARPTADGCNGSVTEGTGNQREGE